MNSIQHMLLMFVVAVFLSSHISGYGLSQSSFQQESCFLLTEPTGNLSGYVTDTLMNPLSGALVRVYFHETYEENYSNSVGYYHVANIPLCYCLKNATCSKQGYQTEWVLLSIGENTTYDFILTPLGSNPHPVFNGTMGNNGIYVSCVNVTFVNIDDIDSLFYKLDSGGYIEYTDPFMICESGMHDLWWYWIVQGQQSEECVTTLRIDRDSPLLQLSSQRIGLNMIKITAEASDMHSGIDRVEFFVDDELFDIVFEVPYETMVIGFGIHHQVKAIAFDYAGNSANSSITTSCTAQGCFHYQGSAFSWLFFLHRLMQQFGIQ